MDSTSHHISVEGNDVYYSLADEHSSRWLGRYAAGQLHEPAVTTLLLARFKRANCFADVGAFLGYYTCMACVLMPEGSIHSFEVDRENFDLLRRNVELNGCENAVAVNMGVGGKTGTRSYVSGPDPFGAGHRLTPGQKTSAKQLIRSAVSILVGRRKRASVVTLDRYFKDRNEKPDLVKIDVEGAEMEVLRGMEEMLTSHQPLVFVELHRTPLEKDFGSSTKEVLTFLKERGYSTREVRDFRDQGSLPNDWDDFFGDFLTGSESFDENTVIVAEPRSTTRES